MTALSARNVENTRPDWQAKYVNQARSFRAIAFEREYRRVLEEVLRVEVALPPLRLAFQKNTGSR